MRIRLSLYHTPTIGCGAASFLSSVLLLYILGWQIGRVGKYGRSAVNWSSLVFHSHIILRRLVTPTLESLSRMGCSLHCFIPASKSSSFCGTLKSLFMCLMRNSPSDCLSFLRSSFFLPSLPIIPLHFAI